MNKDKKHIENDKKYKSLTVNKGVNKINTTDKKSIENFLKNKKSEKDVNYYFKGIINKNITILSQAITLIESKLPKQRLKAEEIIEKCLPFSGNSIRIGITGVPGVGKSSFIDSFGMELIKQNNKIAVLAVDPSSETSKGSILGDKTRMERLSNNKNAFIRPSPAAGSLGGVAQKTREAIILCEAAGFNVILIETVGVGQSEVAVKSMVDVFVLLMLSGAGDELQGIKRGIMEMADIIAITKADGENKNLAELAKTQYKNALHLFPKSISEWIPETLTCSSVSNYNINKIWDIINKYVLLTKNNNYFNTNRNLQTKYWLQESINNNLQNIFYENDNIKLKLNELEKMVLKNKITPFKAADILIRLFKNH